MSPACYPIAPIAPVAPRPALSPTQSQPSAGTPSGPPGHAPRPLQHHRAAGFTLIELMVVIAIAVILLGVTVPALATLIQSQVQRQAMVDLLSDLRLARSEAVRRGTGVIVCPRAAGAPLSCSSNPAAAGDRVWGEGWLVYEDRDGSSGYTAGSDDLIRVHHAIGAGVSLIEGNPTRATAVEYVATGRIRSLNSATTVIASRADSPLQDQIALCISAGGAVRTANVPIGPAGPANCS